MTDTSLLTTTPPAGLPSSTGVPGAKTVPGFAWPMPPLASYPLPSHQSEPEPCEVEGRTGQVMAGRMLSLDVEAGVAEVHVPPEAVPLPLRLEQMRRLTLTRALQPLAAVAPGARSGDAAHRLAEHPRQPYTVVLVGGVPVQGETIGHVEHPLGLFVFPPVGTQGAVQRCFYPRGAYERFEIGPPIGGLLVAQADVSPAALAEAVQAQKKMRSRKIGEILVAKRIVTMEQLFAALDQQARLPLVRLGDALVALGHVSEAELAEALRQQSRDRALPLGELLLQRQLVSRDQVHEALATKLGYPWVDVAEYTTACPTSTEALARLPAALARRLQALPLSLHGGRLVVALSDPTLASTLEEIELVAGLPLAPVLASEDGLAQAITQAYAGVEAGLEGESLDEAAPAELAADALEDALNDAAHAALAAAVESAAAGRAQVEPGAPPAPPGASLDASLGASLGTSTSASARAVAESPLVAALAALVQEAVQRGASDIHIEPQAGDGPVQVRLRRDGRLEPLKTLPAVWRHALVARIKTLAELDVATTRRAQLGRLPLARLFPQQLSARPSTELHVTTVPTHQGLEDVVLRLPVRLRQRTLDQLGLERWDLERLTPLLERPAGLLLVVGPARSGRTTTLHALLAALNQPQRTVYTVEERIDIAQPGLRQVEVARPGEPGGKQPGPVWHTAEALRALQGADADVLMVGDLRDAETTRLALDAASSGRLVLAGVAGRNAAEAATRLIEQGLDAHQLADTLLGVHAQRLLPRLCNHCRMSRAAKDSEIQEWLDAYFESHVVSVPAKDAASEREALLADWIARRGRDGRLKRYHGAGCPHCEGSGVRGQRAVHELLVVTREMRRLLRASAPAWHLHRQAQRDGLRTLRQDGIEKMLAGQVPASALRALGDLTP